MTGLEKKSVIITQDPREPYLDSYDRQTSVEVAEEKLRRSMLEALCEGVSYRRALSLLQLAADDYRRLEGGEI